jgi:2,3-bisphosphoglycerate-dependent phosphoglycerate mutase
MINSRIIKMTEVYTMTDPEAKGHPLVLIRHAQSLWNLENRFTGWADPPLTEEGEAEAMRAGHLLEQKGYRFDLGYCSCLTRAQQTLTLMLKQMHLEGIEVKHDWRLNERHYGSLQGNIKTAAANNTTEQQIWSWRRSYLDKAAPLALDDHRHPAHDPRYQHIERARLPAAENLAETRVRVSQFWSEEVEPAYNTGRSIIISSHGNTLRALLMDLLQMSVVEVESFEIPTGTPILVDRTGTGNGWQWRYLCNAQVG